MKIINLTTASDEELTRAVAEAAGWIESKHPTSLGSRWMAPKDSRHKPSVRDSLPPYATSLDALVPLLTPPWELGTRAPRFSAVVHHHQIIHENPSRALAGAYLKSHGWTVEE